MVGSASIARIGITRKVFSPASGGFARYLEILSNPTTAPVTFVVEHESFLNSRDDTRLLVAPADTNNTYLVASEAFSCCNHPNVAEVMAGPNAAVPVATVQFRRSNSDITYQWNTITLSPGQTVIFMHFAVQHNPADNTGLEAQAAALANLSDPNALSGMTDAEKSAVVNFAIPASTGSLTQLIPSGSAPWDGPASGMGGGLSCNEALGFMFAGPANDCTLDFGQADIQSMLRESVPGAAAEDSAKSLRPGDLL